MFPDLLENIKIGVNHDKLVRINEGWQIRIVLVRVQIRVSGSFKVTILDTIYGSDFSNKFACFGFRFEVFR